MAQRPVERPVEPQERADLGAFRAARLGEEAAQRRPLVGKHPRLHRARDDPRPLPVAQADADLVLLHHRLVGVGGALGPAQQRQHPGEALLAGLGMQRRQRREPAPARDQPEPGLAELDHLDRGLLAARGDRGLERRHLGIVPGRPGEPVAHQVGGVHRLERQRLHQPPLGARGADLVGELGERRLGRALGGLPGDRRALAGIGAGEAERLGLERRAGARLGRRLGRGRGQGGQALAGHGSLRSGNGRDGRAVRRRESP